MSYRQCVFAFPTTAWDQAGVLALAQAAARDLATQLDLPAIYARINDPKWAKACGAWLLMLATTRADDRVLEREYFLDFWSGTYSLICHDDSNGFYLFRHLHPEDGFSIGSEYTEAGLALHGDVDRVTVLPEQNAVTLGILKVYGKSLRYLDLLDTRTAWRVYDPDEHVANPVEVEAPLALRNYLESWPGDELTRSTASSPADAAIRWIAVARNSEDPGQILHACQRAIDLAPEDAGLLADAGRMLIEDHPGPAVAMLDRALALAPGDLVSRYNRACAHAKRRDRDAMLADLRTCFEAQPGDADEAAGDDDLARYHADPAFLALVAEARVRSGGIQLPPGLRVEVTQTPDNAFAVVAAPPNGVVMMRIGYYPYGAARIEELTQVAPPDAITREACAAYGARLAVEIAKRKDLTVSVIALATTKRGIAGWICGVGRVWRIDDRQLVSPSPYFEIPPGVELPPDLIFRAVLGDGPNNAEWFEAPGKTFAIVMTHPLPDELGPYARDVDDVAADLMYGIAGWWVRP